jgi:cation diffusion facilitator family transporter
MASSRAMDHAPAAAVPQASSAYGRRVRRVLWIELGLNLAVSALNAAVGFFTGSLAVLADALHSLTDGANNILGLVVTRWSTPPPDREHPYGHQKFEAMGALAIAAFLGIACFEVLQAAFERLVAEQPRTVTMDPASLGLLVVVLAVNVFVALYERREGRRLNSPLLLADAEHTLGDIWITLGVLGGAAGLWLTGWQWIDLVLAAPVAAAVLWSGWNVLRRNLPWLLDATARGGARPGDGGCGRRELPRHPLAGPHRPAGVRRDAPRHGGERRRDLAPHHRADRAAARRALRAGARDDPRRAARGQPLAATHAGAAHGRHPHTCVSASSSSRSL